ncbi:hypothetical protein NDU88_006416 [Pleurodeles waltl]|uniref:Uncharacterized protein n=1 Tax=Pleurodeles waltl TaxID=8319 RepID=A0AAV7X435_PLEWA|nr:hypothetical protein NDU88_006416 [Pleurodeles waltl]
MGRYRWTDVSQGNTMEQYTTVVPLPQCAARLGGTEEGQSEMTPAEEPSQAEILAAIQGLKLALEGKIVTVAVEIPEGGLSEDTVGRGMAEDPALRIEIQHDGTMAAVPAGSVDGSGSRPELDSLLASAQD